MFRKKLKNMNDNDIQNNPRKPIAERLHSGLYWS